MMKPKTPDAVFTNTYSAKGGIILTASKAYAEGVQKSLLANEYQFAVLENGNEVATRNQRTGWRDYLQRDQLQTDPG